MSLLATLTAHEPPEAAIMFSGYLPLASKAHLVSFRLTLRPRLAARRPLTTPYFPPPPPHALKSISDTIQHPHYARSPQLAPLSPPSTPIFWAHGRADAYLRPGLAAQGVFALRHPPFNLLNMKLKVRVVQSSFSFPAARETDQAYLVSSSSWTRHWIIRGLTGS